MDLYFIIFLNKTFKSKLEYYNIVEVVCLGLPVVIIYCYYILQSIVLLTPLLIHKYFTHFYLFSKKNFSVYE